MNLEIFKRNLQLYKLGIAELEGNEKKIYNFLMDNLFGLNTYITDEAPDYSYFGKSTNEIVLRYSLKNELLLVKYSNIWSFFNNDLYMDNDNIEELMEWWVEHTLSLKPCMIHEGFNSKLFQLGYINPN